MIYFGRVYNGSIMPATVCCVRTQVQPLWPHLSLHTANDYVYDKSRWTRRNCGGRCGNLYRKFDGFWMLSSARSVWNAWRSAPLAVFGLSWDLQVPMEAKGYVCVSIVIDVHPYSSPKARTVQKVVRANLLRHFKSSYWLLAVLLCSFIFLMLCEQISE